ncbi:OmpA family protein, partial [Persicitalea sp.]|uniref:OmpA family protein n=1 Tax=Persicitalea sp. TaxID=3100273 RepID=UPI003593A6F2
VAMWRQKQRLRVYVDELKVFDLPRIFPTDIKLNAMRLHSQLSEDDDQMFLSNIRLAVGAPDTRSKLITEGKFVTTGITFDVNSANIKSESYAVLKDIAETLQENASVKVKIIGHTDSDGEEAANLALSKKRAESVKEKLASEFGIDKGRLETDGKGETAPTADNGTPEGKANNRRVEFVKM